MLFCSHNLKHFLLVCSTFFIVILFIKNFEGKNYKKFMSVKNRLLRISSNISSYDKIIWLVRDTPAQDIPFFFWPRQKSFPKQSQASSWDQFSNVMIIMCIFIFIYIVSLLRRIFNNYNNKFYQIVQNDIHYNNILESNRLASSIIWKLDFTLNKII